ncbi:hypothetical protein WA026_023153 [Henosepilachna vigintioctopunctata]|uniref:Uncharacterized protein n=1 Tax=Henosepilachna vigintioctopunctata TaxID=420089 RepID=A0AAW1TPY8_9CUCU
MRIAVSQSCISSRSARSSYAIARYALISSDLPSPLPVIRQLHDSVMDRFTVFSIAFDISFRTRDRGGRRQPQLPLSESIKGEIHSSGMVRERCQKVPRRILDALTSKC